MSKTAINIVAILLLFLPLLAKVWTIGDYAWRKTYYATVLCEKKNEVKNCCEGRCQLKKQLNNLIQSQQQTPEETPVFSVDYKFDFYISPSKVAWGSAAKSTLVAIRPRTAVSPTAYLFYVPQHLSLSVFQPPELVA